MKRRITLSIVLAVSIVLVSLTSSDSTAQAQNQMRLVADTGDITLGENQTLRISVVSADGELGGGIYGVRFRQINYGQETCSGGVCKHTVESQTTSPAITVAPSEAVWIDVDRAPNTSGTRAVVLSSRRNVRVNGIVFDTSTQRVVATIQISIQRENQ